jgi:CDP-glycerol glycerophosphotransferase (TagB/SpsB family)
MNIIIRFLKKFLNKHQVVDVNIKDNYLHITIKHKKDLVGRKYLLIRDRKSGRRFQAPLKNENMIVSLDQLSDVNREGVFDVYLKTSFLGFINKRRTPFNSNLKLIEYVDYKNKNRIKIFKTKSNNLSISSNSVTFDVQITNINLIENGFEISGNIHDFENQKPVIGDVILIRRDTKTQFAFPVELNQVRENNNYTFKCQIDLNSISDNFIKNARFDVQLKLKDAFDKIVYSNLINLQNYKEFEREEERYLLQYDHGDEDLTAIYATMGRNSLALWYTDKGQFEITYTIAKGKSVYNEVSKTQDLNPKMIFFESFFGKNYSGNPKYIYEEMLSNRAFKDFTFVWSYSGEDPSVIPGNPIIVDRETDEYYKYLALSKYWVSNIVFPVQKKREGNVYIQTWHGTPLKKLGFDIEIEGPETLARENFYIESRNWDYLISANRYSTDIFRRAFKFEKEVLEVGYPLNDIFYKNDLEQRVSQIKSRINIPSDKKVILYAPTWRDNEMVGSWEHSFNLKFDLDSLYNQFGKDYVLLLRMHHLVSEKLDIDNKYSSFVYDLSHYDDIQELYIISDILVTDYSSVFFDYANSKRPILFYAYDYEDYKDNIRGFYLDMEKDLPGPVLKSENELFNAIANIDKVMEQYASRYEEFYNRFCYLDDGKAADRVIKAVFEKNGI